MAIPRQEIPFIHKFEAAPAGVRHALTILLLHGNQSNEEALLALGRKVFPRAALLSLRGQIEEGKGFRYFKRGKETKFDMDDMKVRGDQIAEFVQKAAAEYGFDPHNVMAVGYSNGSNMLMHLVLEHPGLFRAAALLRPIMPYEPKSQANLQRIPILITAGTKDEMFEEQKEKPERELTKRNAQVDVRVIEDADHKLVEEDEKILAEWMKKNLGSEEEELVA